MISVLLWRIFLLCIFYVHNIDSVRIFDNVIPGESSVYTVYEPYVVSKTCMLIPQYGPCRSNIKMWYYNPSSSNCSLFDWGGCQGNGNRFDTFEDCWGYCMSKPGLHKIRPKYCGLSFDYGFCFGAVERWYYDQMWKVCKKTIYSGCGGNKNNFYNEEQCDQICRFGNPPITTQRTETGGTRKVIIINPWNTTPRRGLDQTTRGRGNASSPAA